MAEGTERAEERGQPKPRGLQGLDGTDLNAAYRPRRVPITGHDANGNKREWELGAGAPTDVMMAYWVMEPRESALKRAQDRLAEDATPEQRRAAAAAAWTAHKEELLELAARLFKASYPDRGLAALRAEVAAYFDYDAQRALLDFFTVLRSAGWPWPQAGQPSATAAGAPSARSERGTEETAHQPGTATAKTRSKSAKRRQRNRATRMTS